MQSHRLRMKGFQIYSPILVTAGLAIRALPLHRPHILIACMPKSGSTFLANLVASYASIRRVKLLPDYGDREQELCELRLLMSHGRSYVAQQHLRNSEWTQELIRRYSLTPVVLCRNLADCVLSIRDHIRKERNFGSIVAVNDHVMSLDDESLDRLIIQVAMPWYLGFFEGWHKSDALILAYEDVVSAPARILRTVLVNAGVKVEDSELEAAVHSVVGKQNRLNVGTSGRGRSLSDDNKARLRELVALFPSATNSEYIANI